MPHQCVHCKRIYPIGSKELLEGCSNCGGHFFFYIKDEQLEQIKQNPIEIPRAEVDNIERDVREIVGVTNEEIPVVLDIESVRVMGDGKFEIDLVNLFDKKRPLVYKLEEGKYVIDIASSLKKAKEEYDKKKAAEKTSKD
ncbi:Zn-ribbon containing protein [uncultured archaeon]|nr:Zn-ribbon containing protein [uncultured archaeon]